MPKKLLPFFCHIQRATARLILFVPGDFGSPGYRSRFRSYFFDILVFLLLVVPCSWGFSRVTR